MPVRRHPWQAQKRQWFANGFFYPLSHKAVSKGFRAIALYDLEEHPYDTDLDFYAPKRLTPRAVAHPKHLDLLVDEVTRLSICLRR